MLVAFDKMTPPPPPPDDDDDDEDDDDEEEEDTDGDVNNNGSLVFCLDSVNRAILASLKQVRLASSRGIKKWKNEFNEGIFSNRSR